MTVPSAVTTALQKLGEAGQTGILWPRAKWLAAFPGHATAIAQLPDRIARESVYDACIDAPNALDGVIDAFIATMIWGYGKVGYARYRTSRALATIGAAETLLHAAQVNRDEGGVSAYRVLANNRLDGLGPAFGTKFLHFCPPSPTEPRALILDRLVSDWLRANAGFSVNPVPWRTPNYERYMTLLYSWQGALGISATTIETAIFVEQATRRGGQWAG